MKASARRVDWKGCGTALVTPFDERGRIDFGALERLVEWQIREGIDFLACCATAGESATLSGDERQAITAAVVAVAGGRVPVLAGAGGNHTAKAALWARDAERAGADGIVSVAPRHDRPTPEGLFRHYSAISDASSLPIVVGTVPGPADLDVETLVKLATIPNVIGVQEGSTDLPKLARLLAEVPSDFAVFSGDDRTALALIALGARGVFSLAANEIPGEMRALVAAALDGDGEKARKLQAKWLPLMETASWESSPAPIKCALALMKKCGETLRLPLAPVGDETRRKIEVLLATAKLLPKRGKAARTQEESR